MGPDVQWGLELRRQGYKNYVDCGLAVEHRTHDGKALTLAGTTVRQVRFLRTDSEWTLHGLQESRCLRPTRRT